MQVRIAITPPRLPRWRRKPAVECIDLRGAAETANLIEKYGSGYLFMAGMALKLSTHCPRNSVELVNMGVPR
jgi:hypothetical protein